MALYQHIKLLQNKFDGYNMDTFVDTGAIAHCMHLFYNVSTLFSLNTRASPIDNPTYPNGLDLSSGLTDGAGVLALKVEVSLIWVQNHCTIAMKPLVSTE